MYELPSAPGTVGPAAVVRVTAGIDDGRGLGASGWRGGTGIGSAVGRIGTRRGICGRFRRRVQVVTDLTDFILIGGDGVLRVLLFCFCSC